MNTPSYFIDTLHYYDACSDPRSVYYEMCPPLLVDATNENTIDIDAIKMQTLLHNLVQLGVINVSDSSESVSDSSESVTQ